MHQDAVLQSCSGRRTQFYSLAQDAVLHDAQDAVLQSCSGRSFTIISDDTWVIPDDTWVISADTWVITDDTWVITDDTWVIPDDTWVIPDDTWVIPDDTWVIPGSLLWQVHPLVAMLLVWWSVPTEFLVLLFRHCILSFFVGVLPVPIELFPLIISLIPVPIEFVIKLHVSGV